MAQPILFLLRDPWTQKAFAPLIDAKTPLALPAAATLNDNYDDNSTDATKWAVAPWFLSTNSAGTCVVAETNSRLELTPSGNAHEYDGYVSAGFYDFTNGGSVFAKIVAPSGIGATQEVYLSVGPDAANFYALVWSNNNATVYIRKSVNNVVTDRSGVFIDAWWRMRHLNGTIFLDTAAATASDPPIESDWTNRDSVARDPAMPLSAVKLGVGSGHWSSGTPQTVRVDGFNGATTGGGAVNAIGLSAAAFLFSDDGAALSKLEGFVSSRAAIYAETAALSRVRAVVSTAAEAWSESSILFRLRAIVATASAVFSEAAALTRIRQIASAGAAVFAETTSFIRIRQLVASSGSVFAESSVLARLRAVLSTATAVRAETAVLARLRGLTAQANTIFGETSVLARLRAFVSSRAAVFSESASISRLQKLIAAGAAVWAESAVLTRVRNVVSTTAEIWSEAAALARLRRFVATAVQVFSESGILSRARGFVASGTVSWAETSILTRLRGFNAAAAAQWADASAIVCRRGLAGTTGSVWNGLAKFAGTGLTSTAAFGFSEAAGLRAVHGFVSSAAAIFLETSILSSTTIFIPHGPVLRFSRERLPFPRAAREDRTRKF